MAARAHRRRAAARVAHVFGRSETAAWANFRLYVGVEASMLRADPSVFGGGWALKAILEIIGKARARQNSWRIRRGARRIEVLVKPVALRRRGLGRFNNSSYRHGDSDLLAAELAGARRVRIGCLAQCGPGAGLQPSRAEYKTPIIMVTLVVISWCAQVPGRPRGAVRRFVASSLAKHMPGGGGGGWDLCRCCGYNARSTRKLGFLRCKLRVFRATTFWFRVGGRQTPMNNTRVCHDE